MDHEHPLYKLSLALSTISKFAESEGIIPLKAVIVYFQILLFNKISESAQSIVSERHPIIDFLVYKTFYTRFSELKLNESEIYSRLNTEFTSEWNWFKNWAKEECMRLNWQGSF